MDRTMHLGRRPGRMLKNLRVFFEVGRELSRGARSQRDVERALVLRELHRAYPDDLPCSDSAIHRACREAEEFFGIEVFRLGRRATFFARKGRGWPFEGFTELGWNAWQLTRDFLTSRFPELIEEEAQH